MLIAGTDVVTFPLQIRIEAELWVLRESQTYNRSTLSFGNTSVPSTRLLLTHVVTPHKDNGVSHHSRATKLCNHQAQRGLISLGSLSWGTSAALQELLCVSWAFPLPLELKSVRAHTKFQPLKLLACVFKGHRV